MVPQARHWPTILLIQMAQHAATNNLLPFNVPCQSAFSPEAQPGTLKLLHLGPFLNSDSLCNQPSSGHNRDSRSISISSSLSCPVATSSPPRHHSRSSAHRSITGKWAADPASLRADLSCIRSRHRMGARPPAVPNKESSLQTA